MHLAEQVYRGGGIMNQKYVTRSLILATIIVILTGCKSNDPSSDSDHRPPLINNESFTNFVPIDIIEIPTNDVSN